MKFFHKTHAFLVPLAILALTSCNSDTNTSSTTGVDTARMANKMPADSAKSMTNPDQDAINYAVTKNTKEIAWLKAGISNSTSKELKEHARMMMTDHQKLDGEVSSLITRKGWKAPSVDTTGEVNLQEKYGKAWDMAYTEKLIADHVEILDMFGKAKQNVKDEDLRTLITKTIPIVQSHLNMANTMKTKMK